MQMKCPHGHEVELTYENWRKYHSCPQCEKILNEQSIRNKYPNRLPSIKMRILALDAATGITGYSIYDDSKLVAYGTHSTSTYESEQKINEIKKWLEVVCQTVQPDLVIVEDIQLQKNVQMFQTLANLQGVIKDTLYEKKIPHELVYSSTWRSGLGINKNAERENAKKITQDYVKMCYHINATQDEADAICIGKFFSKQLKPTWGESIK